MPEHQLVQRQTKQPLGVDESLAAQRQRLGARNAAELRDEQNRYDQKQIPEATAVERYDGKRKDDRRIGADNVEHDENESVDHAADQPGRHPDDRAEQQRGADHRERDDESRARSLRRSGKQVTAQIVSAEGMSYGRRLETLGDVDLVRIGGNERSDECQEQDEADQHEAHAPRAVLPNLRNYLE